MAVTLEQRMRAYLQSFPNDIQHHLTLGANFTYRSLGDIYDVADAEHELLLPAYAIRRSVEHGNDPLLHLVEKKRMWVLRVYNLLRNRRGSKFVDLKALKRDVMKKTGVKIPQREIKYLVLSVDDPDKEFFGYHNWYYTGGNLAFRQINGKAVLLTAQGKALDRLSVVDIKDSGDGGLHTNPHTYVVPKKGCPIFQVLGVGTYGEGLVGARVRKKCLVYNVTQDDDVMRLQEAMTASTSRVFTSFDLNGRREMCTIDTARSVKLWDITTRTCIRSFSNPHPEHLNQWSSIRYAGKQWSVLVTDICCLRWLDARKPGKCVQQLAAKEIPCLQSCEDFSLVFSSPECSDNIYLATTHKLLLMDGRFLHRRPLSVWHHQLERSLTYSEVLSLPGVGELVCVGNQHPGRILLAKDRHHLLQLPKLADSFSKAQARGMCLGTNLANRMAQSLTGMTVIPSSCGTDDFYVLTQTAAGDIFLQRVCRGGDSVGRGLTDTDGLGVRDRTLVATQQCDFSHIVRGLRNSDLMVPCEPRPVVKGQTWQMSKMLLQASTDLLSPVLLNAWDIDDEPEWDDTALDLENIMRKHWFPPEKDMVEVMQQGQGHVLGEDMLASDLSDEDILGNGLSGKDILGNDLSGKDILDNVLSGKDMWGNVLSSKDMSGKTMSGKDMGKNMSGKDMSGNVLVGKIMSGNVLAGKNMSGNDLLGKNMLGKDMSRNVLAGKSMSGKDLLGNVLAGQNMSGKDMSGQDMSGQNMSGKDMSGQNMSGKDMSGQNMSGKDMSGKDMSGQNMSGKDMSGQNMSGKDMSGQNMSGKDMWGNVLSGKDMSRNVLSGKDMLGSSLSDKDMLGNDLSDKDLWDNDLLDNDLLGKHMLDEDMLDEDMFL